MLAIEQLAARGGGADAVLRRLPRSSGRRSAASTSPASSVERVLVAGEPGGGEPAFRAKLEEGWGARVTEAMGIGDIGAVALGRVRGAGRHAPRRARLRPRRADRPGDGRARSSWRTAPRGELVLTHLRHRAAPLLRFRTRDHVAGPDEPVRVRPHRPARALHRAHRRHADRPRRQRLPVGRARGRRARSPPRSAATSSSGRRRRASSRSRRCPSASSSRGTRPRTTASPTRSVTDCATSSSSRPQVELVPWGSLQRSEYKSKLVEH